MNKTVFSGLYDPITGKWLAYPSGSTRLADGAKPDILVDRFSGHCDVNAKLAQMVGADPGKTLGFLLFYDTQTDLSIGWNVGSINLLNYQSRAVPEQFRQEIMNAIRKATGLNVKSR
jgi:hypothetical protein